ncbi:HD-GYP domain-containing protein [Undibacterium sp. RuTC16W]|uniref:HD-GYP domain-containing protein n=1 Tax=Undibacterium sp. RuTC16W TaxID=3413048 RepID=UPI003BF057DB
MLKKIPVTQLKTGMYLQSLCGSWIDHPFWRSKFVIKEQNDIRLIIDSGISEVWINLDKGDDVISSDDNKRVISTRNAELESQDPSTNIDRVSIVLAERPKPASITDEIQRAEKICDRSKNAVMSMFQEVRMGKAISVDLAGEVVQEISLSVMRNPGALISLARLKTADDYTYMHSVAVCALMVAVSQQLNLDEDQTREAGMAGLLHDLGKALMPTEVLNKPGRLTVEEFDIMKSHPEEGHRLLLESGSVGHIPLDVCLHHHERVDGSGYPHGLKGSEISIFAKMGAVCDVYDAITSNRPYKAGWEPIASIKKMSEWSTAQYEKDIFHAFVNSVGIYPVGSLVRLSSGRLGVVLEQSATSLLTPKVKIFFSTKSNVYISPEILDLSHPMKDLNAEQIVGHEDPAKWAFKNFDQMWAG